MINDYIIDTKRKEIRFPIIDWEVERGVVNLSGAAYYFIEEMGIYKDRDQIKIFQNGQLVDEPYCHSEQGHYYQIGVSFTMERLSGDYILFRFVPEKGEIHIFG